MQATLVNTIDLKIAFSNPHKVEIISICSQKSSYKLLVNIWLTDQYKSIEQAVVCFEEDKIVAIYSEIFEKGALWKCIFELENGNYFLGGGYLRSINGAKLSLFKENKLLNTRTFDKGHESEIGKIEQINGSAIVVHGCWFKCYPAGGHDEYWPEPWQIKITEECLDYIEIDQPNINQKYFSDTISESTTGDFYTLEKYGISKYNVDGKRLWNQGLGQIGEEDKTIINRMVPFHKINNNNIADTNGVWFTGIDNTGDKRTISNQIFGRTTSDGAIFTFSPILDNFPEVNRIHAIVPGKNADCLLIGETLRIGKGCGLFFLHVHYSKGICTTNIKYANFTDANFQLETSDHVAFEERFLTMKAAYPQGEQLKDLTNIIVLANVDHISNRNNGMVWNIEIK